MKKRGKKYLEITKINKNHRKNIAVNSATNCFGDFSLVASFPVTSLLVLRNAAGRQAFFKSFKADVLGNALIIVGVCANDRLYFPCFLFLVFKRSRRGYIEPENLRPHMFSSHVSHHTRSFTHPRHLPSINILVLIVVASQTGRCEDKENVTTISIVLLHVQH